MDKIPMATHGLMIRSAAQMVSSAPTQTNITLNALKRARTTQIALHHMISAAAKTTMDRRAALPDMNARKMKRILSGFPDARQSLCAQTLLGDNAVRNYYDLL